MIETHDLSPEYGPEPALSACFAALQDHERELVPAAPSGAALVGAYVPFMVARTAQRGRLFVAEVDGAVVGFDAAIIAHREEPDDLDPFWVEMAEMSVLPDHRSRGVGLALLAAVESFAQQAQAPSLRVRVHALNAGAHRFYRRLGFVSTRGPRPRGCDQVSRGSLGLQRHARRCHLGTSTSAGTGTQSSVHRNPPAPAREIDICEIGCAPHGGVDNPAAVPDNIHSAHC
jgi:GNAT superfamily N-acetyltransferase